MEVSALSVVVCSGLGENLGRNAGHYEGGVLVSGGNEHMRIRDRRPDC